MALSSTPLAHKISQVLGLDLRSLALFRIGLAGVVICDLILRAGDITEHYSDAGILPRQLLLDHFLEPGYWSLHLLSGLTFVQALLFAIALVAASLMLVGYQTRLASIFVWGLMISLHNRNPALIFAGDDVLRALLFWAMLLPLGAYYSVDYALNTASETPPKRWFTAATVALMVQQCFIYMWSAAYKTQSEIWWPNGEAVYYSFQFDPYVTGIGHFLLNFPALLKIMTLSALWFEWLGPLLLFFPFAFPWVRLATVVMFMGLHASFGLCFHLGIFPFLSTFSWLAFIPTEFWTWWEKKTASAARSNLCIYFDIDCGFCKKIVYLLRTFLLLPSTVRLTPAQTEPDPTIYADMERINSWVVIDWQDNRRYKWDAIVYIVSLSPVWAWLAPILRWSPLMTLGTRLYEWIATHRRLAGRFTALFKFRSIVYRPPAAIWGLVAAGLLGLATVWNLKIFSQNIVNRRAEPQADWIQSTRDFFNRRTFQKINPVAQLTRLDQSWSIFAPAPPRDDGWHVIEGTTKQGQTVDLQRRRYQVNFEKPSPSERHRGYRTMQWRTYYINLNRNIGQVLLPRLGAYHCKRWNRTHSGSGQLTSVRIYFMAERTPPPGEETQVEQTIAWSGSCDPQPKNTQTATTNDP